MYVSESVSHCSSLSLSLHAVLVIVIVIPISYNRLSSVRAAVSRA
jgi:hypothetical protein